MYDAYYYVFGPSLYRKHFVSENSGSYYVMNFKEKRGTILLQWLKLLFFSVYSMWPLLLLASPYLYSLLTVSSITTLTLIITVILIFAIVARGIGRMENNEYVEFIDILINAKLEPNEENISALEEYDFEFWAWPVNYKATAPVGSIPLNYLACLKSTLLDISTTGETYCMRFLNFAISHTFGIRIVYPGQMQFVQNFFFEDLLDGRAVLIEQFKGKRAKILAYNGNEIDTIFLDRRNDETYENGDTLVVCCEGNCGFYETGCIWTPLQKEYSVLGWNHPGFAGSSGIPYPKCDQASIDGVMQYATNSLHFKEEDIVIFAWSIGGFAGSYAAKAYPNVKFVILDGVFDDLTPLAISKVPAFLEKFVHKMVKIYINLNIGEQLCHYPGPILLIRRIFEEVVTTDGTINISSNRLNHLIIKLLRFRYPMIVDDDNIDLLKEYLSAAPFDSRRILVNYRVSESTCDYLINSYVKEKGTSFPLLKDVPSELKDQLGLFLVVKHLCDYKDTHFAPLHPEYFREPWSLQCKMSVTEKAMIVSHAAQISGKQYQPPPRQQNS